MPTAADSTDGLDATSHTLPGFPSGFVVMNSSPRTFQIYPWERIAARLDGRR